MAEEEELSPCEWAGELDDGYPTGEVSRCCSSFRRARSECVRVAPSAALLLGRFQMEGAREKRVRVPCVETGSLWRAWLASYTVLSIAAIVASIAGPPSPRPTLTPPRTAISMGESDKV